MSADALLPGPTPVCCRCCRRPVAVGPVVDGYGPKCARKRGLLPPRSPVFPRPRSEPDDTAPTLFGLDEEIPDEHDEAG